jgi:lipopolysaccharide export LptBFGC system permease protein LptF
MASFGISLIVGFVYYVLTAICIALGKAGIIIPFLSVSLSHILMLLFSIYLIGNLP